MPDIKQSVLELIGDTPLVALNRMVAVRGLDISLLGKLESTNPGGSVKDRIAYAMLQDAGERGLIGEGSVIIEPTSGNTGVGLAVAAAVLGYRVILTMPETMSVERRLLFQAYGAEVVLTEGALGMRGAIEKAEALAKETPNSFIPGQFTNAANPSVHRRTTGPELYCQTGGQLDILVAGVGSGGTITGAGEYLKSRLPHLQVVAVEPKDSPVLSAGRSGMHPLQGLGAGFVPKVLNTGIYDEIFLVSGEDAFAAGRELARREGLLCGISSGAAVYAALTIGARPENRGKVIAAILPDTGERYLSSNLFA